MKSFSIFLFISVLITQLEVQSQSFIGFSLDNYSGVHGLTFNPANVVGSPFRADINLVSASAYGGSDYFGINVSDVISSNGGFDFESDAEKFPANDNNFFFNADVLGPSFMFNINPKSSIALTSRVRGFMNIHNISGELYESLEDGFDETADFDFSMTDFNGTLHSWGEIGVTYGRILMQDETRLLKTGVTVKFLQGAGAAYFNSAAINGSYTADSRIISSQGDLSYGVSQEGFDTDDIEYKGLTAGFGFDIGAVFQWNSKDATVITDSLLPNFTPYKVKLALSITDIGSVNYKEGEITNYDLNNVVDENDFAEKDIQEILDEYYNGTTEAKAVKINLPTALNFLVDYNLAKKIYASFEASISLNAEDNALANNRINSVGLSPRFESKWLSVYSPLSFRQHSGFAWGFGFRAGPLFVGSGSVLSNLVSDTSKSTDVFVGLKLPLYKKINKNL